MKKRKLTVAAAVVLAAACLGGRFLRGVERERVIRMDAASTLSVVVSCAREKNHLAAHCNA